MTKQELGRLGEDAACGFLEQHGFEIVERNYHSRYGEIDIIAKDAKYLVFAEVKLRAVGSMVSGAEAVTASKARKILKTAVVWMGLHPVQLQPRFDVIEIRTLSAGSGEICGIDHIPSAFGMEACNELF